MAPPRLERFFTRLIAEDASGRSWLPPLLAAAPRGEAVLGDAVDDPGSLDAPLAVVGASGRLGCLECPVSPTRDLLRWYVEHPGSLTWPADTDLSPGTAQLRRALIDDDPPGAQARAQERAGDLLATSQSLSPEWWKLEDRTKLDCVLTTYRVAIVIVAAEAGSLRPATAWYPERSELVRALEAARQLAGDRLRWGALVLSEAPLRDASSAALAEALPVAAPHLSNGDRARLQDAYLGNMTWEEAARAVGLEVDPEPRDGAGREPLK